jgi:hypothetical protein
MSMFTVSVDATGITARHATAAQAVAYDDCATDTSVIATATGSAKRDPDDVNDPETGKLLATGRALEALGRKLQKQADGRVRAAAEAKRVRKVKAARGAAKSPEPEYACLHEYLTETLARYGLFSYPVGYEPEADDPDYLDLARLRAKLTDQGVVFLSEALSFEDLT